MGARRRGGKDGSQVLAADERDAYLQECRTAAIDQIAGLIGERDRAHPAYRAVLDYPLREAKGLRPALSIALCRALGGSLAEVLPTASVFELLHNAFLVHDDVEDGAEMRRHVATTGGALLALLDGRDELHPAIVANRVRVRAMPRDAERLFDAMRYFVEGCARSSAAPALLEEFRSQVGASRERTRT
jgi:geranylgeranyl pyrophosphate synthase